MADRNGIQSGNSSAAADPLDRQPPHNLEAERAVIGSILLLPEIFDEVALRVRADDFYDQANRLLFTHLVAMRDAGQSVDPMVLVDRLKKAEQYEVVGGRCLIWLKSANKCQPRPTRPTMPRLCRRSRCSAR